mmetsp:Transcript_2902/g.4011  ORF Transcript_2902/g.4011 Transcript_2902/m.4011 type:complete len:130 (+) Transcript_2902:36-425(+)
MSSVMRGLRPVARVMRQPVRKGSTAVDPATLPFPDNVVRKALPHDWQIVLAIVGMYSGLVGVAKLCSGGKKEEAPAVVTSSSAAFPASGYKSGVEPSESSIPSMLDESFDAWSKVPGNMAKYEAEFSKM